MDGLDTVGPFVGTILQHSQTTGEVLPKKHRLFESIEEARAWLYKGSVLVYEGAAYVVEKSLPETLAYETKFLKTLILIGYDPDMACEIADKKGLTK